MGWRGEARARDRPLQNDPEGEAVQAHQVPGLRAVVQGDPEIERVGGPAPVALRRALAGGPDGVVNAAARVGPDEGPPVAREAAELGLAALTIIIERVVSGLAVVGLPIVQHLLD